MNRFLNNDFYKMIEAALKAPSGHNTQPWKFKLDAEKISIAPDWSKKLPVVDHNDRELFISLGCATENLCITAFTLGYKPQVLIRNNGIIDIILNRIGTFLPHPLYDQITERQTNRKIYNNQTISEETLTTCIPKISEEDKISLHSWGKSSSRFNKLKQLVEEGNRFQMEDKAFLSELKSWMRFNKKASDATKDGLSYAVFGAPNFPAFISKSIISLFLNANTQNKADLKRINSASHFILFTSKNDDIESWITLGRYLQQFLLSSTRENIAHSYMNQPCEVEILRNKIKSELPIAEGYPQILLRVGYSKKTAYSKRREFNSIIIS